MFSQYFLRVGLCPTRFLPVHDAWRPTGRWMRSGRLRSRGLKSTRSSNQHVRYSHFKWTRSERLPDATWRHEKHRIFIKNGYRLIAIGPSTLLKLHRTVQAIRGRTPRSRRDRAAIVELSSWNRLHWIRRRPTES